jgi:hypothetical protein
MSRSRKAEPTPTPNVDDLIDHMQLNHLQCRDFGHAWRPWNATWSNEDRCYHAQLRCSRCKTVRVRLIGQNGALIDTHYDYPDGYLVKGMGRLTGTDRDHVRLVSVTALLTPDTDDE